MLYIVSTPIGNLGDISQRALDILKSVDLILAEDTRNTRKLLDRYKITTRVESLHEHSADEKIANYIEDLKTGTQIAYVSDAGTPNISDPGGKLVFMAYEKNLAVSPIPGPSSLTALISVAPFSCSQFTFQGFFPKKKGREKMVTEIKNAKIPFFFFESPMRVRKTLSFLKANLPEHSVIVGRELTKIFEQIKIIRFSNSEADQEISTLKEKGEFFAIYR